MTPATARETLDPAEPSETRRRILDAALAVFAEQSYDGASTREIARRAAVHQPAIAYHFRNKELLWQAAVDDVFKHFDATLREGLAGATDEDDRLLRLANVYVRFVAAKPAWVAFVIHEGMQTSERSQWLTRTWLRPQSEVLFRAMTGRPWPRRDGAALRRAMSVLGILTGSTALFAQRAQLTFDGLDTGSDAFVQGHVQTVYQVLRLLSQLG